MNFLTPLTGLRGSWDLRSIPGLTINSPACQRSRSSFVGLEGLRLRNAETKMLVSKTALKRSVTHPIPVDSGALADRLPPDLIA
jgi:hypothetical protein